MEEGSQEDGVREPCSFRAGEEPGKDVVSGRSCGELGSDQHHTQVASRGRTIVCARKLLGMSCSWGAGGGQDVTSQASVGEMVVGQRRMQLLAVSHQWPQKRSQTGLGWGPKGL